MGKGAAPFRVNTKRDRNEGQCFEEVRGPPRGCAAFAAAAAACRRRCLPPLAVGAVAKSATGCSCASVARGLITRLGLCRIQRQSCKACCLVRTLPGTQPLSSRTCSGFVCLQMNAFFNCMAKFTDVEDKCAAERRALTNCATAAVRRPVTAQGPGHGAGAATFPRAVAERFHAFPLVCRHGGASS